MGVLINSGHDKIDSGAVVNNAVESAVAISIRNELQKIMPEAKYVPDDLNLDKSIHWINDRSTINSLAIDIHLNSHSNPSVSGTEVFYGGEYIFARLLSENVSEALSLRNRGAKDQSKSWVESLAFINQIRCKSVVLEVGFLSNKEDNSKIMCQEGYEKTAQAIKKTLDEYFGKNNCKEELKKQQGIVATLLGFINYLFKKNV